MLTLVGVEPTVQGFTPSLTLSPASHTDLNKIPRTSFRSSSQLWDLGREGEGTHYSRGSEEAIISKGQQTLLLPTEYCLFALNPFSSQVTM